MRGSLYALGACLLLLTAVASAQQRQPRYEEEAEDYFSKWLKEDVVYIISEEERAVFELLSTPEEKERFIEQFWFRRDPDPTTPINEFKEEHYRRIAYANERFTSGYPGWKTDRGRIYILHGPPDQIESHASGGAYERPFSEGGGLTATYPFEVWRYRNIPGLGDDIVIEFVDRSLSGEYRLALGSDEKDALLHVPGAGLTLAEQEGISTKADRPYFNSLKRDDPLYKFSASDNQFVRYEKLIALQAPPQVKYADLQQLVQVNVQYSDLDFRTHETFFRLNPRQVLAPLTVEVENKNLSFREENGVQVARVALYGVVTTMTKQLVAQFEHDLVASYGEDNAQDRWKQRSVYQKLLVLDQGMRYRLDLVIKDLNSGRIGVVQRGLIPPTWPDDKLSISSVVLCDAIQPLTGVSDGSDMFVIGDMLVLPSLDRSFRTDQPLGLYFQTYNARFDESTQEPELSVNYRLLRAGHVLRQKVDLTGESIQYVSGRRIVFATLLSLADLDPGDYRVEIELRDLISGQQVTKYEDFSVIRPQAVYAEASSSGPAEGGRR